MDSRLIYRIIHRIRGRKISYILSILLEYPSQRAKQLSDKHVCVCFQPFNLRGVGPLRATRRGFWIFGNTCEGATTNVNLKDLKKYKKCLGDSKKRTSFSYERNGIN